MMPFNFWKKHLFAILILSSQCRPFRRAATAFYISSFRRPLFISTISSHQVKPHPIKRNGRIRSLFKLSASSTATATVTATKKKKRKKKKKIKANTGSPNLSQLLQICTTPKQIIQTVLPHFSSRNGEAQGRISTLVLVRLSKMSIGANETNNFRALLLNNRVALRDLSLALGTALSFEHQHQDVLLSELFIDAIKAVALLTRSCHFSFCETLDLFQPFLEPMHYYLTSNSRAYSLFPPNYLSGLMWSYDCFALLLPNETKVVERNNVNSSQLCLLTTPKPLIQSYQVVNLPFRIRPGYLHQLQTSNKQQLSIPSDSFNAETSILTLSDILSEVNFQAEEISKSNDHQTQTFQERRLTAWQGVSDKIRGFEYSGKIMKTVPFTPHVLKVRNLLHLGAHLAATTTTADSTTRSKDTKEPVAAGISEIVCYDCCLLNLYPNDESGMRYHIDPDQGTLWTHNTSVVSFGVPRRFSFRKTSTHKNNHQRSDTSNQNTEVHNFVVMEGDVTEMFDDCQKLYQHCVKQTENKQTNHQTGGKSSNPNAAARISLVFKKSL